MEEYARYFTVEKEYLSGEVWRYEVNSDGTKAGDRYSVESEDIGNKLVLGFLVQEYTEQGMLVDVEFYPVKSDISKKPLADDTGVYVYQNDEDEVLKKIINDHPAGEWQNNEW